MRQGWRIGIVGVVGLWAGVVGAKDCTGGDCVCGDRLVANWSSGNLGAVACSTTNGLRLAGGVWWDGDGTTLVGSGGACGVKFEGDDGQIVNVNVTGWVDGVCSFTGSGHRWQGASAAERVTSAGNSRYGVHVTSDGFQVRHAYVENNGDEGIHLGSVVGWTVFGSYIRNNATEQVYPLNSTNGTLSFCTISGGTTGIYLKDSDGTLIEWSEIIGVPIHLFQGADTNQISDNTINQTFVKIEGNGNGKPDGNWLTRNTITRNNTKLIYKNPGVNNNVGPTTWVGTGTDITCEAFAGGGTNYIQNSAGLSISNHNGCLTLY